MVEVGGVLYSLVSTPGFNPNNSSNSLISISAGKIEAKTDARENDKGFREYQRCNPLNGFPPCSKYTCSFRSLTGIIFSIKTAGLGGWDISVISNQLTVISLRGNG